MSDTFDLLLDGVRRFVNERLIPLEAKVAEDDAIPADALAEMRELGLFGISIPEEFGGLGLNMEEECRTMFEFCRCSPAFRSAFGTNVGIGSQGLVMFGTPEQKAKYLPGIASGEIVTSFALTEPEAGSDSGAVRTKAEFQGDHYLLNGSKRFITNAARASLLTVMARTNQDVKGGGGVSSFLVPRDLPGVSVGKPEKKMGQQGAHIHDVNFDNVKVPIENRLGEEGQGFRIAMQVLDRGRLHISSVCVGVAERLIEESVRYAAERKQFGQAIASFQMIQAMLADCRAEANAGRAMVLEAARKRDRGEDVVMDAAAAKLFCSEMVGRVADRAVQIFGGSGYVSDFGVERFYRDVRIFRLYEGTSEIQRVIIAREMMKQGR
ncbi:MAG TPA: acyl-CoA dehydrogenase family protein [Verrucomicrobiae bacterium]|jgi:acyl-CoA dehydrogenase|nr:acyl-CoA dehydrogenase family protein [Verrucomicrobiae bacterium]